MASKLSLFLAELKRRKVVRVAAVYALVGLGVIEGASMILPTLQLEAAYNYIVILVLFGFPIALVLAWALEVTPQGLQRTPDAAPDELASHTPAKWRASTWVLAGASLVAIGVVGYFVFSGESQSDHPPSVVAVMPFENLTGDESLDDVGRTASMVLTQALERTGLVTVKNFDHAWVAFDYAESQVSQGGAHDRLSVFANDLGAGTVINGAYHIDGGQIRFDASLTDARSGRILRSVDPVTADRDSPGTGIDTLQTRVISAMALEFDPALAPYAGQVVHTPTLEAAREFGRGARLYLQEREHLSARDRFLRAHELDPQFFTALIFASWASTNLSSDPATEAVEDSIDGLLFENQSKLTPYESAIVDAWMAGQTKDYEGAIRAYGEACDLAPGEKACFNLAHTLLYRGNQPRRAIDVLTSRLEPEKGWTRGYSPYWIILCKSYHAVGDFASQLECVEEGRKYHPNRELLLYNQPFALAGLGRVEEVLAFLSDSLPALGVTNRSRFLALAGSAAFTAGQDETAERVWEISVPYLEARVEEDPSNPVRHRYLGLTYAYLGRLDGAEKHLQEAVRLSPQSTADQANLGYVPALRGDEAEARRVMDWIDTQTDYDYRLLAKAILADALGEREEAWSYLSDYYESAQEAISLPFDVWIRLTPFRTLRDYQPYRDLVWPSNR